MRFLAFLIGAALLAGEFARRGESALFQPKAWDDLVAGALLLLLGIAGTRARPALHAAGWALFTGVMLATLGINADALVAATGKPRAGFYTAALALACVVGTGATLWWARKRG
jgi:hypothetical protein